MLIKGANQATYLLIKD